MLLAIDVIVCAYCLVLSHFLLTGFPQFFNQKMSSPLLSGAWLAVAVTLIGQGIIYEASPFASTLGKMVALKKISPEGRLSLGYGHMAVGAALLLVWLDFRSPNYFAHYLALAVLALAFILHAVELKQLIARLKTS